LLIACEQKEQFSEYSFQGKTMGTQYHIRLPVDLSNTLPNKTRQQLQTEIDTLLASINQEMSTYLADASISRFNQLHSAHWFPISTSFLKVIEAAQSISQSSQGAFDITVMPLVNLWGFGTTQATGMPSQQKIDSHLKTIGYKLLQSQQNPPAIRKLHPRLTLDLSAIAKGYAVDAIALLLEQYKINHYLIEIGGEIRVRGTNQTHQAWRIAIEKPTVLNRSIQQGIKLNNIAVATSGDYRNYYEKQGVRYSHTIDPKTGKPITHKLASVTVLHASAMLADAYATTIMVLGEEKGRVYAQQQNLMVYMILRKKDGFSVWHNLPTDVLLPHL
jgi:thiamine biosynthesis lipoprotein